MSKGLLHNASRKCIKPNPKLDKIPLLSSLHKDNQSVGNFYLCNRLCTKKTIQISHGRVCICYSFDIMPSILSLDFYSDYMTYLSSRKKIKRNILSFLTAKPFEPISVQTKSVHTCPSTLTRTKIISNRPCRQPGGEQAAGRPFSSFLSGAPLNDRLPVKPQQAEDECCSTPAADRYLIYSTPIWVTGVSPVWHKPCTFSVSSYILIFILFQVQPISSTFHFSSIQLLLSPPD